MSLVTFVLRRSLGEQGATSVGLFNGGTEIDASGYERLPVKWRVSSRSAGASVMFGPYQGQVTYDRYVLFSGDEVVDEFPEESQVTLPRGFTWEWKPEVVLG